MATTITSTYAGEVLDELLSLAVIGNETVEGGHIYVKSDIKKEYTIPRLKVSNIIKDRKTTPASSDSGDVDIDEVKLTPQDFMVYLEFNPRDLEEFWKPFQPSGALVYRELPASAQVALAREIMKNVGNYMGKAIWVGDQTSGTAPYNKFDGLLTKLKANADVIDVPSPVALTEANIIAELKRSYALVSKEVRDMGSMKCFISKNTFDLYEDALINLAQKGVDPSESGVKRFKGKNLVPLNGFPDDTILWVCGEASMSSNIWMGIDYSDDENVLKVERLQANSELFFFKMLLKADTQVVFGEEAVLYQVSV